MTEALLLILFALTIAASVYMGHRLDQEPVRQEGTNHGAHD